MYQWVGSLDYIPVKINQLVERCTIVQKVHLLVPRCKNTTTLHKRVAFLDKEHYQSMTEVYLFAGVQQGENVQKPSGSLSPHSPQTSQLTRFGCVTIRNHSHAFTIIVIFHTIVCTVWMNYIHIILYYNNSMLDLAPPSYEWPAGWFSTCAFCQISLRPQPRSASYPMSSLVVQLGRFKTFPNVLVCIIGES